MIKVGDKVCVVMLPEYDINGNEYDVIGGGGTVLEVKENSVIVKLFDGATIEAEGKDFEVCRTLEECMNATCKKIIYAPCYDEYNLEGFDNFFNWIFARQNTILWIDELMSIGTVHKYPMGLHKLMIMGRSKHIGVWSCTQRPSGIPSIVPANSKYFFVFNLYLNADRKKMVETTGFDELNQIPEGHNFWFCKMGAEKPVLAVLG